MKGRISFSIKNKHIEFKLDFERNVTIITGDSGTIVLLTKVRNS